MGSLIQGLRISYQKNSPHYRALMLGRFPDFVYGNRIDNIGDQLPVFVFHSLEPEKLEAQLRFLTKNGYRSIRADECVAILTGSKSLSPKTVALTIDDGLGSLWAVGHPLLRKYGHVAIAFVVAGLVPEGDPGPTLEDVCKGAETKSTIKAREKGERPLATWSELREMVEAGTVDVQSHSWNHDRILVSSKIVEFLNPWFDYWFFGRIHLPVYLEEGVENYARNAPHGIPIYQSMPRLAAPRRFIDDERLRKSCITLVKDRGAENFFKQAGWEQALRKHVLAFHRNHELSGRFASAEELERGIRYDLLKAREVIEDRIGLQVSHLAFPWFQGSEKASQISCEVGYKSNLWGALPNRRTNHPGDDPLRIVRVPEEYLFRLPGGGRKSLSSIVWENIRRNAGPFVKRLSTKGTFHKQVEPA